MLQEAVTMGGVQLGSRWDNGHWAYSAEDMGQRRRRRREALLEQQRATMDGNTGFHLSPEAVRRQRKEGALREQ